MHCNDAWNQIYAVSENVDCTLPRMNANTMLTFVRITFIINYDDDDDDDE